jgi:quercetin dioxygenase-like cupin family protein
VSERFRTEQPGITSWHGFSAGPHYDPARLSLGPIVGVDEHVVQPGHGFDWHGHRGVVIASWVLAGTLRHDGADGSVRVVRPGELFVQSTGSGIRHRETNASETEPLRFVQITVLGEEETGVTTMSLPANVGGVTVDVRSAFPLQVPSLALVLAGEFSGAGKRLEAGAFRRFEADGGPRYEAVKEGAALVLELVGSK